MKRYVFIGLMALLATTSCKEKTQEKAAPVYKKMTVELSNQTLETAYSATMTGKEIVEVRPQVSGLITKILIKEGDKVKKGQPLFVIDQVPYQAALNTAEAALESAKAAEATAQLNYDSRKQLRDEQVISDFDLQTSYQSLVSAKARVSEARAQLTNARNSLGYTVVRSPLTGVAGMIPYHVGALVSSNITEPLVRVSDDHEMLVYFSMSEREIMDLTMANGSMENYVDQMPTVKLKMTNGSEYDQEGKVDAVSGLVDEGTGAVSLRATFPNPRHILRNGGSATVILRSKRDNVIVIPQSATLELQNKVFVYRIVDGKAKITPVEVNRLNNGTEYVVENGLQPGEIIVAEGAGLVRDGEEIR